jgi:xylulokinase
MSLICFKNGSLARERIRDAGGYGWEEFSRALRETPPGNRGRVLVPWFEAEITPHVPQPGERRYRLDPRDAAANVRAVVEAQMLSMAIHSDWMEVDVDTIHATGGAARNREILRVMSDVHDAEVYQLEVGNSACLGAALRAFHAHEVHAGRDATWERIIRAFVEPRAASRIVPDPANAAMYRELKEIYRACEEHALGLGEDPSSRLQAFEATHRVG